ncbi:MAG: UvrD-helicase domain-containing protein [Clostridia bacterium]|nr:UvrD-helicase domain-containing protein [Clostridia bacterium]
MLNQSEIIRFKTVKRKLFDQYYNTLNDMQREAVYSVKGPLLVLAGAGSGKTTVLVKRISHIIKFGDAVFTDAVPDNIGLAELEALEMYAGAGLDNATLEALLTGFAYENARPYSVLAFTFTNKAAGEIKERLTGVLGESASDVWAGTFHSICVRILRKYIERLGYTSDFTIYDTDDCKKLAADCVEKLELNPERYTPKYVTSVISKAKNSYLNPENYFTGESDLGDIFAMYQKRLKDANAVDFDDIINHCVRLLSENEDILEYYSGKFRYVFVDEYQDTNKTQYMLMNLLSSKYRNVMVVGDDDQSIYKFRGATVKNILDFDKQYTDAKTVYLEQNYRSTGMILGAANSVIKNNSVRKGKELWTQADGGEKITVEQLPNQELEATYVVEKIQELVVREKYKFSDIAILYRTNAQSMTLETILSKSGIPHRLLSGTRFFDRKEIKDMVAYLAVINNNNDNLRLTRIINVPKRGIGKTTVDALSAASEESGKNILEIIHCPPESLQLRNKNVTDFAAFIKKYTEKKYDCSVSELIRDVAIESGYIRMLEDSPEDQQDKIDNINELISSAIKYQESTETPSLAGFLEEVALVSDLDNYDTSSNSSVLMTIHSAKGLEFPVVFLVGMEENIFPSSMSANQREDLEEERRLAYVAITRAKKKLFMTCAASRLLYGRTNCNPISRFVSEIPEKYYTTGTMQQRTINMYADDAVMHRKPKSELFKSRTPAVPKFEEVEIFAEGDRVVHRTFGEGTVLSAKAAGGDMLYEIEFDTSGRKKLLGNYAKLKRSGGN